MEDSQPKKNRCLTRWRLHPTNAELYQERGHEDGHDLDVWLHAEAEVKGTAVKRAIA